MKQAKTLKHMHTTQMETGDFPYLTWFNYVIHNSGESTGQVGLYSSFAAAYGVQA